MKRSPIQLIETTLLQLSIAPSAVEVRDDSLDAGPFAYDKVVLQLSKGFKKIPDYWKAGAIPHPGIEDRTFYVQLGLRTPKEGVNEGPYDFEVLYSGVVAVVNERVGQQNVSAENLALQYGLTLLYGVIREQLGRITAKMPNGSVMLPTMQFMDEKLPEINALTRNESDVAIR